MSEILFYLLALMTVGSALLVVISRNIVRTAVALLFTLVGVAGLYFLLNAEFLAAAQLVVYVGGTLILIIFGVMLTSKSPFSKFEPTFAEVMLAIVIAAVLLWALVLAYQDAQPALASDALTYSAGYPVKELGVALLGEYLIPFELISLLLLVVMIGAAYLAKARRHAPEKPEATP